jgi:membrane protein
MPILLKIKYGLSVAWTLTHRTFREYQRDNVLRMGAALAYYTVFSLPALVIIMIGLVGTVLGQESVSAEIYGQLGNFFGTDVAQQVHNVVQGLQSSKEKSWIAQVSILVLLFGASGAFYALQDALNSIYGVYQERRKHFLQVMINRLISISMLLGIGFLLLASLIINALLVIFNRFVLENKAWLQEKLSASTFSELLNYLTDYFFWALNVGLSFALITLFFALIYKILPDALLRWKYVWSGAFLTAILFWIGKALLEVYIANANFLSAYGAAGSLVVILLWVYYSSQLVFIGAEFIKVLSEYNGVAIVPRAYARKIIGSEFVQARINAVKAWWQQRKDKQV